MRRQPRARRYTRLNHPKLVKLSTPRLEDAASSVPGYHQKLPRIAAVELLLKYEIELMAEPYKSWLIISFGLREDLSHLTADALRQKAADLANATDPENVQRGLADPEVFRHSKELEALSALADQIVADCFVPSGEERPDANQALLTQDEPQPAVDHTAVSVTRSPPAPPQATQQPSQPKGRESFVERTANRFSLELRALKNLVIRVGKSVEEEWRTVIWLFVLAISGVILTSIPRIKTRSILPAWHEPFHTLGEIVDSNAFVWIIIAILVYPSCSFLFGLKYRVHIWISAAMTCVVCAVLVSILVADAQDTDSYEAAMEEVHAGS